MRIVSFNIKRGAESSIVRVADAINELNPEVCLVQELDRFILRSGFVDQYRLILKRCGFSQGYFFQTRAYNGFGSYGHALYVRKVKHTEPEIIDFSHKSPHEKRLAFTTNIHTRGGLSFALVGTHLAANQQQAKEQLRQLIHELRFRAPKDANLIFAGDLNLPPSALEKYDFQIEDTQFSCGVPVRTARLDYIVGRGVDLSARVVSLPGISDHDPVVADLKLS